MESQRVRHNWVTFTLIHLPTVSVFLGSNSCPGSVKEFSMHLAGIPFPISHLRSLLQQLSIPPFFLAFLLLVCFTPSLKHSTISVQMYCYFSHLKTKSKETPYDFSCLHSIFQLLHHFCPHNLSANSLKGFSTFTASPNHFCLFFLGHILLKFVIHTTTLELLSKWKYHSAQHLGFSAGDL